MILILLDINFLQHIDNLAAGSEKCGIEVGIEKIV